ncbi:hypothetical protein CAQU_11900 [Corynebacterium aquilae DSM 44791]|uniref:NADH:flavin oxidoreductase/NADH oxidase N-terminal domain-containing protein n=1 Tax=Corynebacterium aquilae DSM 44791 TaxID=1431546 RepID=A0A1L7CID4_9CORY|nr:hypothetical protein CAQU_11900 [Corynebacterium aquilae DSM 44791]
MLQPLNVGSLTLSNRIVFAPLTRMRAATDGVPNDMMATYYAQRSDVGLIVTEGTYPSQAGMKYVHGPGIINGAQQAGWKKVADAVHNHGGTIVMQLMHAGFSTHEKITGEKVIAASAVDHEGFLRDAEGNDVHYETPEPVAAADIPGIVDEFVAAATRALDAGLDGVEVHSANGYLLHQFLSPHTNLREDNYGGSPAARARLTAEVTRAIADAVGADKVGIRLSPGITMSGVTEDDPEDIYATYQALMKTIAPLKLAYVSILHRDPNDKTVAMIRDSAQAHGTAVFFNDFSFGPTARPEGVATNVAARAEEHYAHGAGDAIAIGRMVGANPSFVHKLTQGLALNVPDPTTFYTHDAAGYIDYP